METVAQIEKYITGKMSREEKSDFEKVMKEDKKLRKEVATYRDIIAGIEHAETDAFTSMMQDWEQKLKTQQQPQPAKVRSLFRPGVIVAIAAAVVLLLTFIFVFNPFTSGTTDPFQAAFQPYPDEITIMGDGNGEFDQKMANKAMAFYNAENYREALPLLKTLADDNPEIAVLRLYQGIAEMQTADFTAATASFSALQNTSYARIAEWYQALTQVRYDNSAAAKTILKTIANTQGHPYQKQARELLEELK